MEIRLKQTSKKTGLANTLLVILRRFIAIVFILFALGFWGRIIGLGGYFGPGIDTMPAYWQMASVILAVTMPVAAIGLWGLFAWGTSTWLVVMAYELWVLSHNADTFGNAKQIIWFHIACLATYIAIKVSIMIAKRSFARNNQSARLNGT